MSLFAAKLAEAQLADAPPEVIVPEGCEAVGTVVFKPLDLAADIPPPEVLLDDLLYAEGVHLLSGHPGCGKTTMSMHMANMAMAQGRHVVWLDYESGQRQTLRRMKAMGLHPPTVTELFHYADFPHGSEDYLLEMATRWPKAFVVLDSFSKALADAGVGEDDNSEVTKFTVKVVKACKQAELPVAVIDHITKAGDESLYSRGAGAKLADVDVHWRVTKTEDFNREQAGVVQLKQKKDRDGYFPFETWWKVGDGNGLLTIDTTDGPPSENADPDGTQPSI